MRMKNMYFICKKNLSTIKDFTYTEESVAGGFKNRIVNNYTLINHALTELYEIDCLKSSIDIILGICTTFHRPKCYYIYNDDYGKFVEQVKLLANSMQTIVDLGNDFDFEDCESGFDIKLPSGLSFSDLSSCITDINKALEQCPYLHESDEKIEFKSLDVGSEWLSFTTECTAVGGIIVVFSKIVDKAVQIASHIVTVQQQHEQYKTLKLQNGLLDSIVSANTIVIPIRN